MHMVRSTFYLLMIGLFSACSSVNYVGIETYNPAEVTFPESVRRVLIVNNAVPQPADVGYEYNLYGVAQDTCKARADSALFDACRTLGQSIDKMTFFDEVLLYHVPVRKDNVYYTDTKLTSSEVASLCNETGADAIISVDRLLFETKKNVVAFAEGYVMGIMNVEIGGVLRSYLPGRETPLATVYVADSIYWSESAYDVSLLNKMLPAPENAIRAAGEYMGSKAYINFVPYWEQESRWYYTNIGAAWKEATAYASAEKWNMAAERWDRIYNSPSTSWRGRAKAASNLALSYEMKGKLQEAYDWASKSYKLFNEHNESDKNTQLLKVYVDTLLNRIRSDKKLNMQFGKE